MRSEQDKNCALVCTFPTQSHYDDVRCFKTYMHKLFFPLVLSTQAHFTSECTQNRSIAKYMLNNLACSYFKLILYP